MNRDDIRRTFLDVVRSVAPEAETDTLADDESLREQLDIDSMDLRHIVQRLHERLGVDVPEAEYRALDTVDGAVDWLAARLA